MKEMAILNHQRFKGENQLNKEWPIIRSKDGFIRPFLGEDKRWPFSYSFLEVSSSSERIDISVFLHPEDEVKGILEGRKLLKNCSWGLYYGDELVNQFGSPICIEDDGHSEKAKEQCISFKNQIEGMENILECRKFERF